MSPYGSLDKGIVCRSEGTVRRAEAIEIANVEAATSRRPGAPRIYPNSSRETLLRWLVWCDPNGEWSRHLAGDLREEDEPIDLEQAWAEFCSMVESAQ